MDENTEDKDKVELTPTPEDDLNLDVHEQSFEDILSEEVKTEDKPVEETPAETPKEEAPAPVEREESAPVEEKKEEPQPIDPDALAEKVSQATAEKMVEAFAEKTTATEDKKDELTEYLNERLKDAPWVKEDRSPSYAEMALWLSATQIPFIKDQIKKELEEEVVQEEKTQEEQAKQVEQEQEKLNSSFRSFWELQFKELQDAGKLPAVSNPKDQNDPGVKARLELLTIMRDKSVERIEKGLTALTNVKEVYYEHYLPNNPSGKVETQPAGADAPIAGTGKAISQGNDKEIDMAKLHKVGFEDILAGNA